MHPQFLKGTLKGSFIALLTLLIQVTGNTQTLKSEWAKTFESSSQWNNIPIASQSVVNDSMGNTFVTGIFMGTVDFDPGPGTFNLISTGTWPHSKSTFILKLDTLGEFVWAASIDGGPHPFLPPSVSIDDSGNISIVGLYSGIVDLDPDTSSLIVTSPIQGGVYGSDVFIVKLDNHGDLVWGNSLGANVIVEDHTLDTMGNIYITGFFSGTVDFDLDTSVFSMTANGHSSIFVLKLSNTGDFLWAKSYGGSSHDHGKSIEVDNTGNVFITGYFENLVDFDPGAGIFSITSVGRADVFILKLDNDGSFITAKAIGGFFDDGVEAMCMDVNGNIYITGSYAHLVDFDPDTSVYYMHTGSGQDRDMYVLKLSGNGDFVWSKSIETDVFFLGGYVGEEFLDIASDGQDGIYLTGKYQEIVDFDPGLDTFLLGPSYPSLYKMFYQKLDTNGEFVFAGTTSGSAISVNGSALSVMPSGEITLVGYLYGGPEDFDPGTSIANLSSTGSRDMYIQRLLQCEPSYGTHITSGCNSYQWIDGITYTASNSSVTFNIECGAHNGCDSIVNLDLTIFPLDLSVTTSNDTLIANETGAIYQWLDCNNNYSEINGETAKSFNPTTDGSYAVLITKGDCKDTSLCQHVVVTELDETLTSNIFRIYPNPNLGEFTIEFTKEMEGSYEVSIQNSFGQIIKSYRPLKKSFHVDLTSFDKGIYFVKVDTEKGAIWSKIIMQ